MNNYILFFYESLSNYVIISNILTRSCWRSSRRINRLGKRHEYEAWRYQYLGGKINDKKSRELINLSNFNEFKKVRINNTLAIFNRKD